jgi:hypothetical protein
MAGKGRTKGFTMPEEHRLKIATSNILNRLNKVALGEITCDAVQLRAMEIALSKTLPSLQSQDVTITETAPFALIPDVVQDLGRWQDTFKPGVVHASTVH